MGRLRAWFKKAVNLHTLGYLDAILVVVFGLWLLTLLSDTYGRLSCNEYTYSRDKRVQFISEALNERIGASPSLDDWQRVLEETLIWEPTISKVQLTNGSERVLVEVGKVSERSLKKHHVLINVPQGESRTLIFDIDKSECFDQHSINRSTMFWIPFTAVLFMAVFSLLMKFFIYGFIESRIERSRKDA